MPFLETPTGGYTNPRFRALTFLGWAIKFNTHFGVLPGAFCFS
jgi:hypothetical protein